MSKSLLPTLTHMIDRDGEKYGFAQVEDQFGMVRLHLGINDPSFGIEGTKHPLELSPTCARKLAAALLAHAAEAEKDDQR